MLFPIMLPSKYKIEKKLDIHFEKQSTWTTHPLLLSNFSSATCCNVANPRNSAEYQAFRKLAFPLKDLFFYSF